jgi:hypothetical protein
MSNSIRTTKRSLGRQLQPTAISVIGPTAVSDPHAFLREHLGDDAIVVIESADRVRTVTLASLAIDATTILHAHILHAHFLHAQGFSASRKCQARVARTPQGWIGDAVCECDAATPGARQVLASDGRMMCLGTRVEAGSSETTYGEARIKPFALPIPNGPSQVDVQFRNYHEETASGRLACIAHRVTGFVAREEK